MLTNTLQSVDLIDKSGFKSCGLVSQYPGWNATERDPLNHARLSLLCFLWIGTATGKKWSYQLLLEDRNNLDSLIRNQQNACGCVEIAQNALLCRCILYRWHVSQEMNLARVKYTLIWVANHAKFILPLKLLGQVRHMFIRARAVNGNVIRVSERKV